MQIKTNRKRKCPYTYIRPTNPPITEADLIRSGAALEAALTRAEA